MSSGKKRLLYLCFGLGVLAILVISLFLGHAPNSIRGAVLTSDGDPARELPIGDVEVKIVGGLSASSVRSDAAGYFSLPIPWHLRRGQRITIGLSHPSYLPLVLPDVSGDLLCIAHLVPLNQSTPASKQTEVPIANLVVRYSIGTTTMVNVGSAVKTFQAVNTGNVPCKGHHPCSPDGKWRAAEGSAVMDAGVGNEFRNARASCIAGPCPFTKIEGEDISLSPGSRTLKISALDWSDTATFLFEAEVYKPTVSNVLRQSYPLIFGRDLTFTLPGTAEGVSIEAEIQGSVVIFPLGPALFLSWADCQLLVNKDKTRVYRCELKSGYRFAEPGVNGQAAK